MIHRIVLGSLLLCGVLFAQTATSGSTDSKDNPPAPPAAAKPATASSKSRTLPQTTPPSARQYYAMIWGVDSLAVKSVESGEMIRFTYRVLDPGKAKVLNDKKSEPSLIDPKAGVSLVIPSLEKVGKLRQSSTPEAGKLYWMAFSNKGGYVKPGHRVNVVIGQFRAEGLVVQ